ncbi:GIY-YIG nuclease family protein, partial [Streptomyces sp. NPDC059455]|uniref:GIY-YIG nuclease family protein n=1 Tax=Streptomyces sp. NPDC059455 TaxID=3346837 RepID=UPI0036C01EEB
GRPPGESAVNGVGNYGDSFRRKVGIWAVADSCLLGLELRRVGSGKRMTFGKVGEATLSQWMADTARVCWVEQEEPWALEAQLISRLDLPLNLDQNGHNGFHSRLKELRAQARQRARELPISA